MYNYNRMWGMFFIVVGLVLLFFVLGDLLLKLIFGLFACALINHGLRLRGLPPLQFLFSMWFSRKWF